MGTNITLNKEQQNHRFLTDKSISPLASTLEFILNENQQVLVQDLLNDGSIKMLNAVTLWLSRILAIINFI